MSPTARLAITLALVASAPAALARFTDVTAAAGIAHTHGAADITSHNPLLYTGGSAVVDINGDGWLDLYMTRLQGGNRLYVNRGDGTFADETIRYGLEGVPNSSSAIFVDIDRDADPDLVLSSVGGTRHYLYVNNGDGTFTEEAVVRGVAVEDNARPHQSYSISAVDYDRDGWMDLHICEHYLHETNIDPARHTVLLRNKGAAQPGFFENVTIQSGLAISETGEGKQYAYTGAFADFDKDGWPDLALIADFRTSRMFWNNGNGTFTEATNSAGLNKETNGMGATVGDYDGDGFLDLYATSIFDNPGLQFPEGNTGNRLYRYAGNRQFEETSASIRVRDGGWAWGTQFFDYDNDGDLDLVATNGLLGTRLTLPPEQTRFWTNPGQGSFIESATSLGITDNKEGTALLTFDYDNDGDLDLLIVNSLERPVLYRNDTATTNRWLRLRLHGTLSNSDGYGATIRVEPVLGGPSRYAEYNPTNLFLAQGEPVAHFGLGAAGPTVARVTIRWPSGAEQVLTDLAANTAHDITEPGTAPIVEPRIASVPAPVAAVRGDRVELTVVASGTPQPSYTWFKDGVRIDGVSGPTLLLRRAHPTDAGTYTVVVNNTAGSAESSPFTVSVDLGISGKSAARAWNELGLEAVRLDLPRPPVHARNLFHLSAAMWDAWVAYDTTGIARHVIAAEQASAPGGDIEAARAKAISHAAYTLLKHRYAASVGGSRSVAAFDMLMHALGCDPNDTTVSGSSPVAVGNRIGAAVIAAGLADGSNEVGNYSDDHGYAPANEPLIVKLPGAFPADPNRWQPLALDYAVTQNGIPLGAQIQTFVGSNWGYVKPFAIFRNAPDEPYLAPAVPPLFGTSTHETYVAEAVSLIRFSSLLDPELPQMIDISPKVWGNNPLGTNDGGGYPDFDGAPNPVKLSDYGRVLAEYWADGPTSETPPGHWNSIANEVSDHPATTHLLFGHKAVANRLEWDVKLYLALNGALHDAAIAAWDTKEHYDYVRPITMIRHLCGNGQSSSQSLPSYDPGGIPLVPGLIELITPENSAPGAPLAHLAAHIGEIALRSWRGEPRDPRAGAGGVGWILGVDWVPYQRSSFVTPPFAAYVSGHSTFSRAAAEVLALMTGSPVFPGGAGGFTARKDEFLVFERGPTEDVRLDWHTYFDAADEAGISRLYGGIHISADDFQGRIVGSKVGLRAFNRARAHFDTRPSAGNPVLNLSLRAATGEGSETLIAGFYVSSTSPRPMLLRAVGPTLSSYEVVGACTDPLLSVYAAGDGTAPMLVNDDWELGNDASRIRETARDVGAFELPAGSSDAAAILEQPTGGFTMHVRPASGVNGTVLAEVYDIEQASNGRLVNISGRGTSAGPGRELIAGFVVREDATVLVRAVGPGLADFDVEGVLPSPRLTLWRMRGPVPPEIVASNAGWSTNPLASAIEGFSTMTGAFPLEHGSSDSAVLVSLSPGAYTAVVDAVPGTPERGVAIVEVYLVE